MGAYRGLRAANPLVLQKVGRAALRKVDAFLGRFRPLQKTLDAMALRPFELHLELTNLCNADCVFCPYQYQTRPTEFMCDSVFEKAVGDFVAIGGGSVGLTPIVGDALIDPKFLERVRQLRALEQVDRIWVTTNAILADRHGIAALLDSGISSLTISTAGFDEAMYRRVYRSASYRRMKNNVLELLKHNSGRSRPVPVTLALRPDRPLREVMKDPDFQPILEFEPELDFTWSYTSAGGRIKRENLPQEMRLRKVTHRKETCVNMFNGPIVLPDGTVLGCNCVAAMDAVSDLGIGNVLETNLGDLWTGERMKELRASFGADSLNPTCAGCDMYRDLELYRTTEGRARAALNRARHSGRIVRRTEPVKGPFAGG